MTATRWEYLGISEKGLIDGHWATLQALHATLAAQADELDIDAPKLDAKRRWLEWKGHSLLDLYNILGGDGWQLAPGSSPSYTLFMRPLED